ncbi:hypothetical protein E1B28_003109 [Marasmius oreades]|uniref:Uncharacterized protein n=1 Tax=Marasmius oreades TaxID=181124 RepID=A0A9P7RLI0_9AGAR|nr:uncharacterized protein E1B28_003109 [Marasmius oreades]KAG7085552.1 hypothetical protein E1B28_003109 [Marasmius oreades]
MPTAPSAHQPPSSATSGDWNHDMIPPFSHFDPESVVNDPPQYHPQRYQQWIDTYALQQQQQQQQEQQQQQQQQPGASYSPYNNRQSQSQHQFTFSNPLPGYNTTTTLAPHAYSAPSSDGYGYHPGSDVHPPTQNHSQSQGSVYQNVQHYPSEIPGVAGSSNASSHGHSPPQWSDETGVFDVNSTTTATRSTSMHPSPSPSYGATASRSQQRQQQFHQNPNPSSNNAFIRSAPSSAPIRNTGKRKRTSRRSPLPPIGAAKRVRERDYSDDESDDDDCFGISVGMGGLTGVSGTLSGKRGKGARLPGACTHCKKLKVSRSDLLPLPHSGRCEQT